MDLKVDDIIEDKNGTIRIMAIIEGYVMMRHLHCYPFIKPLEELIEPKYRSLGQSANPRCNICGKSHAGFKCPDK